MPCGRALVGSRLGSTLKALENLGHLPQLTELYLGKNKITKLQVGRHAGSWPSFELTNGVCVSQGLEALVNLKVLSLQVCPSCLFVCSLAGSLPRVDGRATA